MYPIKHSSSRTKVLAFRVSPEEHEAAKKVLGNISATLRAVLLSLIAEHNIKAQGG